MTPADEALSDLLRDEPFLRRLALRLVEDPAAADDLVQETWLEALRRRPLPGPGLRAWAATVLRRGAARRRRGETRRATRERGVARPERVADPLAAVERRLDAQVLVVELLRGLPVPQREALVLRHAEGLGLAAIAARQGTSVDTVKARLRRGLAALRVELDRRHGGDRAHWAALLAPLAEPPPAPPALAALSLGGLVIMSHTLKLVLACALVVAAALTLRLATPPAHDARPPAPRDVEPASSELVREEAEGPVVEVADAVTRAPVDGAPDSPPSAAPSRTSPELVVRLVGQAAGEAEVRVSATTPAGGSARRARERVGVPGELRLPLDARLLAEVRGERPAFLGVAADHPDLLPAGTTCRLSDAVEGELVVTLELAPAAVVVGRVHGAAAQGPTTVAAYPLQEDTLVDRLLGSSTLASDGTFRLRLDHRGDVALAVLSQGRRPATARATVAPGPAFDVGLLELTPGAALEGEVRGAAGDGTPVLVELVSRGQLVGVSGVQGHVPERLSWTGSSFEIGSATVRADARGVFRAAGLAPELHALSIERPGGTHATWGRSSDPMRVRAPASGIVLESGWARLDLELALPDDLSGEGWLRVGEPDWTPQGTGLHARLLLEDPVLRVGLRPGVDTEARVEFAGYEPVVVRVRAEHAGEVLRRSEALLRPAGSVRLVLRVSGEGLEDGERFVLLDDERPGTRDPGAALYADGPLRVATLEGGRLVFEAVPGGPRRLRLAPGGAANERQAWLLDARLALELPWGGEHVEQVSLARGGALRVEVRDAAGERIGAEAQLLDHEGVQVPALFAARGEDGGTTTSTWTVSDQGWNQVVPNLAPGAYVLRVRAEGRPWAERPVQLEAGVTVEVSVTL